MRISGLFCLFDRHAPIRREAKWDGPGFSGTCRHCNAPIRRKGPKNWRRDWLAGQKTVRDDG